MKWVIPTLYDGMTATSTNGFTIGKSYSVKSDNGRVATVYNDNNHKRVVPLDEGSNAHLQHVSTFSTRGFPHERVECAGYFAVHKM